MSTFGSILYWLSLPLAILAAGALFVSAIRRPETGCFGALFFGAGLASTIFLLILLWLRHID